MIKDKNPLQEIRKQWDGVLALRQRIQRNLFAGVVGGGTFSHFAADCAYNLPFLHACSVLNEALRQMSDEGVFTSTKHTLGALAKSAQHQVSWVNYGEVTKMVKERNALAHRAALLPRGDCWDYLDVIEAELRSWSIIK